MPSPSVTISLAPDGSLLLHLPGSAGDRTIPLRETSSCSPSATIRRVLEGQANGTLALGTDGAPTRHQVHHWERHQTFPDSRCPFCRSSREAAHRSSHQFDARFAETTVIPPGLTAAKVAGAEKSEAARARAKASREAAYRASKPSSAINF